MTGARVTGQQGRRAVLVLARVLAALGVCLGLHAPPAWAVGRYLVEPPLPAAPALSLAEAPDGALWVGSRWGVARFEGQEFLSYDGFQVFQLSVGQDGSVWLAAGGGFYALPREVATVDGRPVVKGLYLATADRAPVLGRPEALRDVHVWSVLAEGDVVWAGSDQGLARVQDDAERWFGPADGLPAGPVLSLARARDGALLVGTAAGLHRMRGGRFVRVGPVVAVLSIVEDRQGRTWTATPDGLYALDGSGGVRRYGTEQGLPSSHVRAVAVDARDRVWAGTLAGVCRMESHGPVCYTSRDGLMDPVVLSLAPDREGGVWVGLRSGGVQRLARNPVENFGPPEGLPAMPATVVLATRSGAVWVATPAGLARINARDGKVERCMPSFGVGPTQARALAEGIDGSVWVGTVGAGVFRVSPSEPDGTPEPLAGLPGTSVRWLGVDPSGELWIAWAGGGIARGRVDESGPGVPLFRGLSLDARDGTCTGDVVDGSVGASPTGRKLFASHGGGLTVMERDGSLSCWGPDHGLPSRAVIAVHEGADGTVWVGMDRDGGVWRSRPGRGGSKFDGVDEGDGLACDTVFQVATDGAGHLWATCGGGVQRLTIAEVEERLAGKRQRLWPVRFLLWSHMRGEGTSYWGRPTASLGTDGRFWVATSAGVSAVDVPLHLPPPPPPALATLRINGVEVDARREVTAVGGPFAIEARLRPRGFPARWGTRYRYRLVGLDRGWTEVLDGHAISLDDVPPGSYVLEALAGSTSGPWSVEDLRVPLALHPVLWRRPWFIGSILAALVAAAVAAQVLRLLRARARAKAQQAERERIARDLHDGLGQGFAGIGFHLEAMREHLREGPAPARDILERTREILERVRVETRRAVWDLYRKDEAPLEARLEELVRTQRESFQVPAVTLEVDRPAEGCDEPARASGRKDGYVEHELYQIAQEALTNAIEHAEARAVRIKLVRDGGNVELVVADDGKGMSAELAARGRPGHLGLRGMRERARALGGAVSVESTPGKGTKVVARVPI